MNQGNKEDLKVVQQGKQAEKPQGGREFKGVVVSTKMLKTVVVAVSYLKEHPKYKKRFLVTKKYKVHNEDNEIKIGDRVIIRECRPISREKKWVLIRKSK